MTRDKKFMLIGPTSGEAVTQRGLIITHTNRKEMEYLFPGTKVVPCDAPDQECIPLPFVRGMESTRFPLNRGDFKDA